MAILDHIHKTKLKRILCKNGAHVSVQASHYHYCIPRANAGPYEEVECGSPSVIPTFSWIEYADDKDNLKRTIYAYLPIKLLIEFIEFNGGLELEYTLQTLLSVEKYIDENDPLLNHRRNKCKI